MKTRTRLIVLIGLLAASLFVGCQDGPRELPFPTFDARAPFDELGGGKSSAAGEASEGEDEGASEFERAIADSMEDRGGEEGKDSDEDGESPGDSSGDSKTVKRQQVPLANSLVSSIPLDFDTWQWSSDGRVTMISYTQPGAGQPDALIYVEGFSELIRMSPSMEIRRFQQTVDPALIPKMTLPGLSGAPMRRLSEQTGLDIGRIGDALTRAASHTMGMGLNYISSEDTFTGWRWVGHNDHDVEMRLGRSRGMWRASAQADADVSGTFSQLSGSFTEVQDVQKRYDGVLADGVGRSDSGWPAWMLVGSAVVGRDSGAHIAIVCKTAPTCPVAAELSEFLARLKPASGGDIEALGGGESLQGFADERGLPFAPADEILSPGDIGEELRKALGE